MSVVIETTLGDITVDLFLTERPNACLNFLKLCKIKYYNYNLFHTISRGFIAQTGDPTGSRKGGESIFGLLNGPERKYFQGENKPRIKHTKMGLISFVGNENFMLGSQFFITLGEDLIYLDEKHCVFGEVVEGFDVLEVINEVICDGDDRPYQDVRITHTVILDDPFSDPERILVPSRSPSPTAERLMGGRIAPDEEIDEMEGKNVHEIAELQADREAKARATILEMVGDIPDADMAPPENVLFVCKLNPVTTDEDLEIIFNRFGKIKSCEVIRDRKTGDSLQYAFIEFSDRKACEDAYFKMDNILIDDRRIHVDFSQSVSKVRWHGKGRGVTHYDDKGRKIENGENNKDSRIEKINKSSTNSWSEKQPSDKRSREEKKHPSYKKSRNTYKFDDRYENYKYRNDGVKYSNRSDKDTRRTKKNSQSPEGGRQLSIGKNRSTVTSSKSRRHEKYSPQRSYKKKQEERQERERKYSSGSEQVSHRKNKSRRKEQRLSSVSSDDYEDRKVRKKTASVNKEKHKEIEEYNKPKYRSISKKIRTRDSSESSDTKYRREKRKKHLKEESSSSSDSSSEDNSSYKTKKSKKRSDSDSDEYTSKKMRKSYRRQTNSSSDNHKYKKGRKR